MTPKERDELVGQVTAASINLRDVERALVGLAQAGPEGLHNAAVKACIATRALMRALGYAEEGQPILDAVLYCPWCGDRHIDEGEWATRPHHTHLCAGCGNTWRVEPYCRGVPYPGDDHESLDGPVDSSGILDGKKTPISGAAE